MTEDERINANRKNVLDVHRPWTPRELFVMQRRGEADYEQYFGKEPNFTCWNCPAASTCAMVYDVYNTDGDCLAEK